MEKDNEIRFFTKGKRKLPSSSKEAAAITFGSIPAPGTWKDAKLIFDCAFDYIREQISEEEPIKCDEFVASVPFVPSVAGLIIADRTDSYAIMVSMAIDSLRKCKDEITEETEEEDEDEDERDIIGEFIEQNPEARKEDFFQFLKTNGFEIDDELFYINKKGKLYSSLSDYEDFVLRLFVKEYNDVLTIYKTVTNTENSVTCKEKPSEIEVKKMRKKFIEI